MPKLSGWMGCPMINPLCPDDLCLLPFGHEGMLDNRHILSTTPWDTERHYRHSLVELHECMTLISGWRNQSFTRQSLIQAGCREGNYYDVTEDRSW